MTIAQLTAHPRYHRVTEHAIDRATLQGILAANDLPASRAQVEKWKAEGMPHATRGPGRPSRFQLSEVSPWLCAQGYDAARLIQPEHRKAN